MMVIIGPLSCGFTPSALHESWIILREFGYKLAVKISESRYRICCSLYIVNNLCIIFRLLEIFLDYLLTVTFFKFFHLYLKSHKVFKILVVLVIKHSKKVHEMFFGTWLTCCKTILQFTQREKNALHES